MKYVLFAFNGDPICFVHVILNAFDMREKGHEVKVVLEGSAVTIPRAMTEPGAAFAPLWENLKSSGMIDVVCKACSAKLGVTKEAEVQGLPLGGDMKGHPSMSAYTDQGYTVITF